MKREDPGRRGFALLTVLWVVAGMSVLGVLLNRTASEAIGTAQNRGDALRAAWIMEGCLARAHAAIDAALQVATDVEAQWTNLDATSLDDVRAEGCTLALRPVGISLDVNDADRSRLLALLSAAGTPAERADSIAAAIIDWRDADDEVQQDGAERDWYRAHARPEPRNAPFAAVQELQLVRGFETTHGLDALLDVETGRTLLTRAPAAVLATLPGFSEEAVVRTIELRTWGPVDLNRLGAALSPGARTLLQSRMMDLAPVVVSSPDAWLLTSTVHRLVPGTVASIQVRLQRAGRRVAIMRHRSSPWS